MTNILSRLSSSQSNQNHYLHPTAISQTQVQYLVATNIPLMAHFTEHTRPYTANHEVEAQSEP